MMQSLEPPPQRTRACAAPCPARLPLDCQHGTSQDLLGLLGASGNDSARERAICVPFRCLPARAALFHERMPAEAIHIVRSGSFESCRIEADADGDRRVRGFARRGDVHGCGAVTGRTVDILDAAALQTAARAPIALQPLTKRDSESARLHRVPALS